MNSQPHYEHFLPAVRFYWHSVMKNIVQMVEASRAELILDFGCGKAKRLKKYLVARNVIGYDVVDEFSDISDYRNLRPHTIICSHVLEHLEKQQLLETIAYFKRMEPRFIITVQPTENWVSRLCNLIGRPKFLNKELRPRDHKLKITEIHKELSDNFQLLSRKNVLTLSVISKWVVR